jgi:hypothetical protein
MGFLTLDTHMPVWLYIVASLAMLAGGYIARAPGAPQQSSRCPSCRRDSTPPSYKCEHCRVRWTPSKSQ